MMLGGFLTQAEFSKTFLCACTLAITYGCMGRVQADSRYFQSVRQISGGRGLEGS